MIRKMIKSCGMMVLTGALVMGLGTEAAAAENTKMLSLSKENVTVRVGKSFTLKSKGKAKVKVTLSPKKAEKKILVNTSSSNIKVKKLSDYSYKITGKAVGNAVLQIISMENPSVGKSLTVTVKAKTGKKVNKGLIALTKDNFEKEVQKAKGRVVVLISTEWCHWCQLLDPIYKEAAKMDGNAKFCKFDPDKEPELASLFEATGFPTIFVLENDKVLKVGGYQQGWTAADYVKWAHK